MTRPESFDRVRLEVMFAALVLLALAVAWPLMEAISDVLEGSAAAPTDP